MQDKPQTGTRSALFPSLLDLAMAAIAALCAELLLRHFLPQRTAAAFSIGRVAILFITVYTVHRFALVSFRSYKPRHKDIGLLTFVFVFSILTVWLGRLLTISLTEYLHGTAYLRSMNPDSLLFVVPFAAGGLLIQAMLGLHYGIVFGINFALIVGLYHPSQPVLIPLVLVSVLISCLSLSRFRSRSAYTQAGFNVAIISLPFALSSIMIETDLSATDMAVRVAGSFLSGALCTAIAAGLTPVLEYVGGYVTDLRLIEMATLDHPLLKELSIQAPGTWNHSMVMGMMVEQAAKAIGANSVVSRVGAYFHDIGKTKKPMYFVENQVGGENRHDKLSPSMSALIIRSHVKDGIELARKHKLPLAIEDMIPQHHGTSLIEYFYDKAVKDAKEAGESAEIDKSLYSYPGPRPQTKEAGILMLADSIEAATRTIADPTVDRIQGLVQKLINKIFSSGELDECELTLKDLHAIAKSFTRVLTGIYHQRVAYAEPAEKVSEKSGAEPQDEEALRDSSKKDLAGGSAGKKSKTPGEERPAKEDSKEDLKRLGM